MSTTRRDQGSSSPPCVSSGERSVVRWAKTFALIAFMGVGVELAIMKLLPAFEGVVSSQVLDLIDAGSVGLVLVPTAAAIALVRHRRCSGKAVSPVRRGERRVSERVEGGCARGRTLPPWVHGVAATCTLAFVIGGGVLVARKVGQSAVKETLDEELMAVARLAAQHVDARSHAALTDPPTRSGEAYEAVAGPLREMLAAAPEFRNIYTVKSSPEGMRFIVDASAPSEAGKAGVGETKALGEVYAEPDAAMLQASLTGEARVSVRHKTDGRGATFSAFAPVRSSDGSIECLVVVESSAARYLTHLSQIDRAAQLAMGVGVLGSAALGLLVFGLHRRRVAIERDLLTSEARLRTLTDAVPVMVWLSDENKKCTDFNKAWLEFRGRTLEEELGDGWVEGVHPDDLAACLKTYEEAFDARRPFEMTYRLRRGTGEYRIIEDRGVPRFDSGGRFLGYGGGCLDITQRVEAEGALAASRELQTKVSAQVPGLIYQFRRDRNGKMTLPYASAAIERMFGVSASAAAEDASGLFAAIHPDDLPGLMASIEESERAFSPWRHEFRVRSQDGSERWLLGASSPQREEDGAILWHGFVADVTEQKKTERRIAENERRYRTLVEGADVIVWEYDCGADAFTYVSPQAARLGYPLEDWLKRGFWVEHVHPDDRERADALCKAEVVAGRDHRFQYRMIAADGGVVWIDDFVSVEPGKDGATTLRGVLVDITEQKRMQHELAASEARVRSIIDTALDAVVSMDAKGVVTSWNTQAEVTFGWTGEEAIGRLMEDLIIPEELRRSHREHLRRFDAKHLTRVVGRRVEMPALRKGGGRITVEMAVSTVSTESGLMFSAFLRDITPRKRAEEALSIATADASRLAAAVDAHNDPVFLTDAGGRIVRVNPAFERLTGYSMAEVVGKTPRVLKSGKTPPGVYVNLWTTIQSGRAWSGRLCNRKKGETKADFPLPVIGQSPRSAPAREGGLYWVDASITPLLRPDGGIDGFVAVHRDVTAAVRAEETERQRLEDAEARLRVAKALSGSGTLKERLDAAVDTVLEMGGLKVQRKGGVFLLEPGDTHLRMFSCRGEFSEEFVQHDSAVPVGYCLCGRAAASGHVLVSDDCFTDHRHENRWPGMTEHGHYIVPLMDRSASTPVCVGVLFLFTEPYPAATPERLSALREIGELLSTAILQERAARLAEVARARAEEASRAKSEFLANMSHEIRTPLTAILGFADVLREDGNIALAPEQRVQTIDTIRSAGTHLLTVINDILDLSKIEADKMTLERIDTPLVGVLREVESLMRPRAMGKGVTLNVVLTTPVPERIIGDPTRLRQILMNLAGNAVKFTEMGGVTIAASAEQQGGRSRLIIDVEDSGPGMTHEQASRLFMAFGQADGTVTRKHGGTGLGLTISSRLAGLMGGRVRLMRTEPGRGSCFRVELPLEPAPGAATVTRLDAVREPRADKPSTATAPLRGRILLAEDGLDNQRLIAFHLKNAGATVEIADNGRVALELIERAEAAGTPFDLLLTDMQMPEMDGYTLARTLRNRGSTLAIVSLTAHAMAEDRAKCTEAGCDDYATKPIDKATLLAKCARWIGAGRGERSAVAPAITGVNNP